MTDDEDEFPRASWLGEQRHAELMESLSDGDGVFYEDLREDLHDGQFRDAFAAQLREIQQSGRQDMGGRVLSDEEVRSIIRRAQAE